jgi:hypothetical protein
MAKKSNVRTRRMQYDDFLHTAYQTNCNAIAFVGVEFEKRERQHQFHYSLLAHAQDKYIFYDGTETRAIVACHKKDADDIRAIASQLEGREIPVYLDAEI